MFVCDVQQPYGAVSHELRLAPPLVEEAGMEERICECEGVLQLGRKRDGAGRAFACAVRETEHPQGEGRGREGRDPWIVAEAVPAGAGALRLERGDGPVEAGQ